MQALEVHAEPHLDLPPAVYAKLGALAKQREAAVEVRHTPAKDWFFGGGGAMVAPEKSEAKPPLRGSAKQVYAVSRSGTRFEDSTIPRFGMDARIAIET